MRPVLLFSVASLLLCSCHREHKTIVGVVPKGANHIFWQTVHAGAIKAAQEYGFEVEWNAPTLEIDSSRQIEIVDSMVNRKLAGIVLAPVDKKALVAVVERAAKAGVPVSIFDSGIDTKQGQTLFVSFRNQTRMRKRKSFEVRAPTWHRSRVLSV